MLGGIWVSLSTYGLVETIITGLEGQSKALQKLERNNPHRSVCIMNL